MGSYSLGGVSARGDVSEGLEAGLGRASEGRLCSERPDLKSTEHKLGRTAQYAAAIACDTESRDKMWRKEEDGDDACRAAGTNVWRMCRGKRKTRRIGWRVVPRTCHHCSLAPAAAATKKAFRRSGDHQSRGWCGETPAGRGARGDGPGMGILAGSWPGQSFVTSPGRSYPANCILRCMSRCPPCSPGLCFCPTAIIPSSNLPPSTPSPRRNAQGCPPESRQGDQSPRSEKAPGSYSTGIHAQRHGQPCSILSRHVINVASGKWCVATFPVWPETHRSLTLRL